MVVEVVLEVGEDGKKNCVQGEPTELHEVLHKVELAIKRPPKHGRESWSRRRNELPDVTQSRDRSIYIM